MNFNEMMKSSVPKTPEEEPTKNKSAFNNMVNPLINPSINTSFWSESLDIDELTVNLEKVKNKISSNDFLKDYLYIINIDLPKLNDSTKRDINILFDNILRTTDDSIALSYLTQLQWITNEFNAALDEEGKRTNQDLSTIWEWIELLKGNFKTLQEIFYHVWESFWEAWTDILEHWGVDSQEDVEYINAIFSTMWSVAWLALLDIVWEVWIVDLWAKILLKDVAFLLQKGLILDLEIFKKLKDNAWENKDGSSITILALFVIAHINFWYWAMLRFRDYVVTLRWDKDSKSEKVKKKVKVTDEDWKVTYREEMVEPKMKRLFWKYYIDAVTDSPVIFDMKDNLSAEWNEYIKRKKASEAIKLYFYDKPKLLEEFKLIEQSSLQSNTPRYWRRTWRLLENHNFASTFISRSIIPEYFKWEKEWIVLDFIKDKQEKQKITLELFYETKPNGEIIVEKQTDFLKWLYSTIKNNPNLTKKEREARARNLDTFLNKITSSRLIDSDWAIQEIYRITEWYTTKLEAISVVQKEIDDIYKVEKWWKVKKFFKWSKNKLLLKKHHLIKLRDRISNWKFDWVTKEELKKEIDRTIDSKVLHWWNKKSIDFPKSDEFQDSIVDKYSSVKDLLKNYKRDSIRNLENYIKYILPNEDEKVIWKLLQNFVESETPYSEVDFYRELDRIKNWFLPSNQLLEELLSIREKLVKDIEKDKKVKKEKLITRTVKYLNKIKDSLNSSDIEKITLDDFKKRINWQLESMEAKKGDYQWVSDGFFTGDFYHLLDWLKALSWEFWILFKNRLAILGDCARRWFELNDSTEEWLSKNKSLASLDEIIQLARDKKLDVKKDQIKEIRSNPQTFNESIDLDNLNEFDDADKVALETELHQYEWISNEDYKRSLWLTESSKKDDILKTLKERYKVEIELMRVLDEVEWQNSQIVKELWNFSNNLSWTVNSSWNEYTKWQVTPILEQIFERTPFDSIDIDNVTSSISNDQHADEFDWVQKLKGKLKTLFEWLTSENKLKLINFIKDNNVDETVLPENIKTTIDLEARSGEFKIQKGELERMRAEINNLSSKEEWAQLNKKFNGYIQEQKIDSTSSVFKPITDAFDAELIAKNTALDLESKSKKLATQKGDLEKIIKLIERTKNQIKLDDLERVFNKYLIDNNIDPDNEEIKKLVDEFDSKYGTKMDSFEVDVKPSDWPEKLIDSKEFLNREFKKLQAILEPLEIELTLRWEENKAENIAKLLVNLNNPNYLKDFIEKNNDYSKETFEKTYLNNQKIRDIKVLETLIDSFDRITFTQNEVSEFAAKIKTTFDVDTSLKFTSFSDIKKFLGKIKK